MIISNIIGGLGNQMFQYACGRSVSIKNGSNFKLAIDLFENYSLHNGFSLNSAFNITSDIATSQDVKNLLGWQSHPRFRWFLGRSFAKPFLKNSWCLEPHLSYWHGIYSVQAPSYLHGYWQSEKYFIDVSDVIRKDFSFSMPWNEVDANIFAEMKKSPSLSVHIRCGDYKNINNKKLFANCGPGYYKNAIKYILNREPNINIYVFSDEPSEARQILGLDFKNIKFISHNSGKRGVYDMRLMSHATHHIIANSTFSWWGAWLNPSPNKIVIAPKAWFVNGTDDKDLIPSTWIRI